MMENDYQRIDYLAFANTPLLVLPIAAGIERSSTQSTHLVLGKTKFSFCWLA
jgi:hypothetical protein